MQLNKKRYLFVSVFLILVMAVCLPLSFVDDTYSYNESEMQAEKSEQELAQEEEISFTFKDSFTAFDYGLKEMDKGFDCKNFITASASASGISLSLKSLIHHQFDTNFMLETIYVGTKPGSVVNVNRKSIHYRDMKTETVTSIESTTVTKMTENLEDREFDFNDQAVATSSYPTQFLDRFFKEMAVVPIIVSKKTASQIYFRSDNTNYYYELLVKENAIEESYRTFLMYKAKAKDLKLTSSKLTCVSSKKTGVFESMKLVAYGEITYNIGLTVTIPICCTMNLVITKANKPASIVYPPEFALGKI